MSQPHVKIAGALKKSESRPFWQDLEDMLETDIFEDSAGHLNGSMSGESWKAFLKTVRDEVVERLDAYRTATEKTGFCAANLGSYIEEKQKIERAYLRNLAVLYRSAERAYKTLSG